MVQLYTLDDVKQRNGKNGARTWIVIHDIVYDATDYLKDHPGGGELISDVAGKDCTKDFDGQGHSSDAKRTLKDLKIGELVEEDKRSNRNKKNAPEKVKEIDEETTKRRRKFRFFFCA